MVLVMITNNNLHLTGDYRKDLKKLNSYYRKYQRSGSFRKFVKLVIVTNVPSDVITLAELYQIYLNWCRENTRDAIGKHLFSERVNSELVTRVNLAQNVVGFRGLLLSDALEWFGS